MNKKLLSVLVVVSGVLLLATTRMHAQSAYFQAITNLNPVGYWPMHEVEAAAPGDTETNYGTLGLLGTGYYPDWAGATVGIKRGLPGALANDTDTAVSFNFGGSPAAGTYTNTLLIPHTSSLLTLKPPFSVECWVYPTNQNNDSIWSSSGFEGLNAGGFGAGAGAIAGFTLQWNGTNTGFQVYNYYNSSTLNTEGFSGNTNNPNNTPLNHWYHVVVTCDANTNVNLYVNGVEGLYVAANGGPSAGLFYSVSAFGLYTPDYWSPFQVGGGRGNTRAFPGYLDEFAIYTNVLGDVSTHYSDGTSGAAGQYFHDVTNDNPLVYLRMDAPASYSPPAIGTWPILANYGMTNGVAVGNGVYTPGTFPGIITNPILNPNGVPFAGIPRNFAALSGVSSFADAGNVAAYNPIGATPFSVIALFRGNPCDGRNNTIVGHTDNSWNIILNNTGHLVWRFGTNTAANVTSVGVYNDGAWHQMAVVYTPNSNPASQGTNAIYVDGTLDRLTNNASVNGFLPGTNADVLIGNDPQYTNNPAGVGRSFAGQICDVALFNQSLTPSQITTLYSACQIAPFIITQPPASTAINGGPGTFVSLGVTAGGSQTLTYQWYFNTISNYSAATKLTDNGHYSNSATAQLTVTNLANNDSGFYYVVVGNSYGSVTSILASLSAYAACSITSQTPVPYTNLFTVYAGTSPNFSVTAYGAHPISYYWFTNGVLDAAVTSSNLVWANAQIGSFSTYCIVSNALNTVTGSLWSASVIAAPTAPYPPTVLSSGPIGYWRLNEGPDNTQGNDGAICHDYAGGNDGIYTNVYIAQAPDYSSTDPETTVTFGEFGQVFPVYNNYAGQIQGIDFATPNGANGEFTVEAWVNPVDNNLFPQIEGSPVAAKGLYGVDDEFNLGIDSTKTHFRFYVRDAGGNMHVVGSGTSPALDGNWHHIVGVCDEANGQLSLYYDGALANKSAIPTNSGVYKSPEPMSIGAGSSDGVNYTNQFIGNINDVAVYNYALSAAQVGAQYTAPGVPPAFVQVPANSYLVNAGATLTIPATVIGTVPVTYQWADVNGGTNVATGSTNGLPLNATLTVSNVSAAWNDDQLELTVNNAYGSTNIFVTLLVNTNTPTIALTLNLPSPVTVLDGRSYTYLIGATGPTPFSYQWYNGSTLISGATNPSYTVTAGSPGSTTYHVVVTNSEGSVTSTVSSFISINPPPAPTSGYATNLLAFNPAGYWPMHEAEAAARGDVEINYGSLGQLGEGFYPDWGGAIVGIVRGTPGALTNDSDTSVNFTRGGPSNSDTPAGSYTNAIYIPHNSPLTTLVPPFSVECWFYPTNIDSQDIWAQDGDQGLNGGIPPGGSGAIGAGTGGMRLVWLNGTTPGFQVYSLINGTQNSPGFVTVSTSTDVWYHLVLNCDSGTNFTLYVNGVLGTFTKTAGITSGPGSYSPDYWTPITIGGGRGGTRSVSGYIDEFAVYTNVVNSNTITAHYLAGTQGEPGQYVSEVQVLNPVIYLRMDASNYVAPATNFWPVLFNYGSAGANGFYTPGTAPGILPGPTTNATGASLNGLAGNVAMLSGISSYADAGYAPAFNPTGSNADFTVAAMFRGNPCDNRIQAIASHGTNSWQLGVTTNGCVVFNAGNGHQIVTGTGQAPGDISTMGVYNDGNWHQLVAVNQGNVVSIYVDGTLDTNGTPSGITPTTVIPGNTNDVMIGTDPIYTNYPSGVGASFAGQICDVAFITNALNAGEVSALYAAAVNPSQIPAYVAPEPPLNATVAPGGTLSLTAGAAGTSAVGYQWQFTTNGGGTDVLQTGAGNSPLNANLTVSSVPLAWNGGQLELTVTNAYGTDSTFVALSVVNPLPTTPTNIVATVTNSTLYLTWPPNYTGYQLQAQTNSLRVGLSTNWVNVVGSTSTNQVVVPINITNGSVFYRLAP